MSSISDAKAQVSYPAPFPVQGRLPTQAALVAQNCYQQNSQEHAYRQELCMAAKRRVEPPCCKTLHVSLFFDGTGNNLHNDQYLSDPKHPTNISRLFRATIGSGYTGGMPDNTDLLDDAESTGSKYFKYYIPGVGTPFPEVRDLDYSTLGLAGAAYGEERVNWALLRLIDVLMRTLEMSKLENDVCHSAIKGMGTTWRTGGYGGEVYRNKAFTKQLKKLVPKLRHALAPAEPGKPKLLGIKLYIYGFSRGAAEARAFVKWLSLLLPKPPGKGQKAQQCLAIQDLKVPISVEFLGLLDTVASVGVASIAPFAAGHMAWADGTQELPDEATFGGFVKRCVHLVSSHEQRLCFPLDSIRRTNGQYPANSVEVAYPGMHSDLGGGYPPGDQGKANAEHDGFLLSQIALHEMYAAAFAVGAPLKVPEESLPKNLVQDIWRIMSTDLVAQFMTTDVLIERFNAWRELTLGLPASEISAEQAAQFTPAAAPVTLEKAVENQMAWLTGWRINRYAGGTFKRTRFYQQATDSDAESQHRKHSEKIRDDKQKKVETQRMAVLLKWNFGKPPQLLPAGIKDFDPDLAQTQLHEAAQEFAEDYRGEPRTRANLAYSIMDGGKGVISNALNDDDNKQEFGDIKEAGEKREKEMFPTLGEQSNATAPVGLLRALFDDQVHDSRAWFLYAALGGREPFGSYFRYRTTYFGDDSNTRGDMKTSINNLSTEKLPTPNELTNYSRMPGMAVRQQKQPIDTMQLERAKKQIAARWA